MDIDKYQGIIEKTAIYPKEIGIAYCALGMNGEAGEVAEKAKKLYRDKDLLNNPSISEEDRKALAKEIGDVVWYCTALASEIGVPMSDILEVNYNKLIKRRETRTLQGSGDNREEV